MRKQGLVGFILASAFAVTGVPGSAKDVTVTVDARSAPWLTGANRDLGFGVSDARAPKVLWGVVLLPGTRVKFRASGQTSTVQGGALYGPDGQPDWTQDRGTALFPSHYMRSADRPIHLNELVGAFIDADGAVVGEPFPIGSQAEVEVPEGAAAISLGLNDDIFADNNGRLEVVVTIVEAKVYVVEEGEE